jgi:arylsulfatase A-like enzyme
LEEYKVRLHRPGEYAGWLGRGYDPLTTTVDKRDAKDNPYFRNCTDEELNFQIQGLALPTEMTLDRLNSRRNLREQFDQQLRAASDSHHWSALDRFRERAWSLVTSPRTRQALDLRQEPAELRDRYGRHLFGQSTLMARRLVEAGVRFVTVHWDCPDGYSWDSHVHSNDVKNHLIPGLDSALATLIEDLSQRGLLDETLVVCLGEMGRTPQANDQWGRNHWSTLFPAVLAGAGIRGGTVYGASDKDAAYPIDKPVRPEDLAATIYTALGIDPHLQLPDAQGRPVTIVPEGRAVMDLFG